MPAWIISLVLQYIVPLLVDVVENEGIPALEAKYPALSPFLESLKKLLIPPTPAPK